MCAAAMPCVTDCVPDCVCLCEPGRPNGSASLIRLMPRSESLVAEPRNVLGNRRSHRGAESFAICHYLPKDWELDISDRCKRRNRALFLL